MWWALGISPLVLVDTVGGVKSLDPQGNSKQGGYSPMVGSHKGTCPDYQSAHFCGNDKFKSEVNQRTLCYYHLKTYTFCERHKYLTKVDLYFA